MAGVSAAGDFTVPFWAAGALAALFVAGCVLVFNRSGAGTLGSVARYSVISIGILVALIVVDRLAMRESDSDARAIEARAAELTARAIAPGSSLACLDGIAGDTVEAACEKAIFASPETVAAAISYVAARTTLLADVLAYDRHPGKTINVSAAALRRSLRGDRFGFVAHVLQTRDGCVSQNCKALDLLGDATHVRANLTAHTLDRYLNHYAEEWAKEPANPAPVAPVAEGTPAKPKVSVNIDFPSAASIPPVSIMNAEPTGPLPPGAAAAAAANPNPPPAAPAPSRHSLRKHAAPQPPAPPVQAGAQPTASHVPPAAPAALPGPPVTTGPAVVPPVQLVPSFPRASGASAGLQ
jgi:hypothetical protein